VAILTGVFLLQARIDKFTVEAEPNQLPGGSRVFLLRGEAVERFPDDQLGLL